MRVNIGRLPSRSSSAPTDYPNGLYQLYSMHEQRYGAINSDEFRVWSQGLISTL